jgi:hypothetical protein
MTRETVMNIHHLRRALAVLGALAAALLAAAAAPAAAFAVRYPLPADPGQSAGPAPRLAPGWDKHPPLPVQVHTVVTGGMPGWQIALIAAGTALFAAAVAVAAYRARTARRRPVATPA